MLGRKFNSLSDCALICKYTLITNTNEVYYSKFDIKTEVIIFPASFTGTLKRVLLQCSEWGKTMHLNDVTVFQIY